MKTIYVVSLLCLSVTLHAQFQQTNGPAGGSFRGVAEVGDNIYALSNRLNLFRYSSDEWQRYDCPKDIDKIFSYHDSLYTVGYGGVYYYSESNQSWGNIFNKYVSDYSVTGNALYIVSNDTIYDSEDGLHFAQTFDSLSMEVDFFGDTVSQRLLSISNIVREDSIYIVSGFGELAIESRGLFISHNYGEEWFAPEGLPEFTQVTDIAQFDNNFYASTTDGVYISADLGVTWQPLNNGFHTSDSNILINDLVVQDNQLFAIQSYPVGLYRLTEGNWQLISEFENNYRMSPYQNDQILFPGLYGILLYNISTDEFSNLTDNLIASNTTIFAVDDQTVLANTGNQNYLTTDGGQHWNTFAHSYGKLAKYSDGIIYTDDNGINFTDDLWSSMSSINSNLPSNYLPSISALAVENGNIYIGFSRSRPRTHLPAVWEAGGVYVSENGGESWSSRNSGLPTQGGVKVPIYNLSVNGDMLIIRTAEGTFRSTNNGESWSRFENGLSEWEQPIHYGTFDDKIVAATYYGIKYTSQGVDKWRDLTEGLDTLYNTYYYNFLNRDSKLYLYVNEEHTFYVVNDTIWSRVEFDPGEQFQVSNFSTSENYIYASIFDGGVWRGSLSPTSVKNERLELPQKTELTQNYPNPFNPSTTIQYRLAQPGKVKLTIFNLKGETVNSLVDAERSAGSYTARWDGKNNYGTRVSSGVYIYRLQTAQETMYKKMMLLK